MELTESENRPQYIGPKVRVVSHTIRRTIDKSTAEFGITGSQSLILSYLTWNRELRPCQRDIEMEFNIKHPTATGLLQRLEEKGFVRFEPDRRDKRLKRIVITDAGAASAQATGNRLMEAETGLIRGFSEEELTVLHGFLDRLVANARDELEDDMKGDE